MAEELASLGLLDGANPPGSAGATAAAPAGSATSLGSSGGRRARELRLDDLPRLRYLTAVAKEAMRMYPVVSVGNGRCALPLYLAFYAYLGGEAR